jgi:Tfp pilus assembly PilM family ATPase
MSEATGLEIAGLVEDLQDRLRPVKARMFPRQVLLELRDDGLRGQVLRHGRPLAVSLEATLPPLLCLDGRPLEKEPLGDLIGDLLVRDNLIDAFVMAALPPAAVQWRVVVWPFQEWPADPAEALRQVDPDLNLPYPLEEACLDVQPLPGQPAQMLLATAQRSLVEAWVEVFNLAGVQLDRLAPAQSCELLAVRSLLEDTPADQLVVLLDPRPEACRLLLVMAGVPVFERNLPAGGQPLLQELQRSIAFYRRQDSRIRGLRLLVTAPGEDLDAIETLLEMPAELLSPEPYGSLVLQGLATPEIGP